MTMPKAKVEPFLLSLGFALTHSSGYGDEYTKTLHGEWKVSAYASKEGNPFAGTVKDDSYEKVSFSLDGKGTSYRCLSVNALTAHGSGILAELLKVSNNVELLKCPKCKTRYVHVKEPAPYQKWKPFLSCDGMMITGKGAKKHTACDGTSKKIPAVVVFK